MMDKDTSFMNNYNILIDENNKLKENNENPKNKPEI